ncbi:MAG: response regulator [Candidatus Hodarchaeales archaeon]|jgi:two-component system chemotaxis response regulator CheY
MARIMIVDDSRYVRDLFNVILKKRGHEVIEAKTGEEAIELYKEKNPELVLMDILLTPTFNGIQCIRQLREIDPEARILTVSALSQDAVITEALDAGSEDFLSKPFKPKDLTFRINKMLESEQ